MHPAPGRPVVIEHAIAGEANRDESVELVLDPSQLLLFKLESGITLDWRDSEAARVMTSPAKET